MEVRCSENKLKIRKLNSFQVLEMDKNDIQAPLGKVRCHSPHLSQFQKKLWSIYLSHSELYLFNLAERFCRGARLPQARAATYQICMALGACDVI